MEGSGDSGKLVSNATSQLELGSGTWKTLRLPDSRSKEIKNKCSLKINDLYFAVFGPLFAAFSTGHFSSGRLTSAAHTLVSPLARLLSNTKSSPRSPQRMGSACHSSLYGATSGHGCHLNSLPLRHVASKTFCDVISATSPSFLSARSFRRCNRTGASTGGGNSPIAPGGGLIGGSPSIKGGLGKSIMCGGGGKCITIGSMNFPLPLPLPLIMSTISIWILPSCSPQRSMTLVTFSTSSGS
mmetsp:Transcript_109107/g.171985  ORF Transcript_109107/g.171985 Transcript_109107/m.171985 type:complete len:241 (-) Transcript_109107:11-733(-)